MAIPYIWLGKNNEVLVGGTLDLPSIGSDKWIIRPLLGWNRDPSGASPDSFIPALLIRKDNPALNQLLGILGASEDDNSTLKTAINSDDWLVFRFNQLKMQPPAATTVDLADFPPAPFPAFILHKDSISIDLTAIGVDSLFLSVLKLNESPKVQVVTPLLGDAAIFKLSFILKELDLSQLGMNRVFDLIGKNLVFEFDAVSGKLKINDIPLASIINLPIAIPILTPILIPIPIDGVSVFIRIEEINSDLKFGFEIDIGAGLYTYSPLISAISDSNVLLEWDAFRIRLYDDRLGLAAPPGNPGSKLMTATFTLPLIQAKVGEDIANALAKIVPVEDSGITKTVLSPLKFKVIINRSSETVSLEPLLWTFQRIGNSLNSGKPFEKGLQTLKAIFEESLEKVAANLNSFFAQLNELIGLTNSTFSFTVGTIENPDLICLLKKLDTFNTYDYPLPLILSVKYGESTLKFLLILRLNLWRGRLTDNRAYFYIISSDRLDLKAFAIQLPQTDRIKNLPPKFILPTKEMHDGYLDFETLDLVIDVEPKTQPNRPQTTVFVPGDFTNNSDERKRLQLRLEDFDPDLWPEPSKKNLQLRLGARGLTFAAKARTDTPAIIPVSGAKDLSLRLAESRDGLQSGLVVIDNQVRYANLVGRIEVPGFKALEADIQLTLRRNQPEGPLDVIAVIDLERSDRKPLAQLNIAFLKIQLDDLRMQLTWTNSDWNLQAWASGALSVTNDLESTGGIALLDRPRAVPFRDLDLTKLHQDSGELSLGETESPDGGLARFDLLDGQFRVEFQRATLAWNIPEKLARLDVEQARFYFQASSGELDVSIQAGRIILALERGALQFKISSSLGIEVRIGTQIKFAGEMGWIDTARERYFFARGSLRMTGFPEVQGFLKLGTGIKDDGSTAPNLAIFADLPYEAELFSGVVMKRVGLGLGLNNRLAALGSRPEPREILARLDRINPEQEQNWTFVSEGGVYVSVVATTLLGSNRGDVTCAYLAKLILSIDTNIDIVAVAQVWLFSSQQFLEKGDNSRRPALVGAAVLRAREQTFSLVTQTLPNPAIEGNKMLSELLSRVQARFSFYLSPDLADYYLEELSYSENLFGISVLAIGSYRIAIGRFGALFRAQLALRGSLPKRSLSLGIGGFEFSGDMALDADFGGLVTSQGLTAYGAVRVSIAFRVSAYILIPTIAFETRTFEKTFSITISIPYLSCRRWRCKWKTEDITKIIKVKVNLVIPVVKLKPYHLPETTLDLLLEGALAFDESGGIGFSGTLAIATSICGHSLRIAPRFDYRPEVVSSVRSRVAAVEDRINQLRGLPRPQNQLLVADDGGQNQLSVETWYYYTSRNGDEIYHLLVPSPEEPTWWYTPRATGLDRYANLPRDMEVREDKGGASDLERNHLSPFRNAVMRMVLPFVDTEGKVTQVIDLAMPWDRANYDAFPDAESRLTEDERIALLIKLKEIESAFLNTAALADKPDAEEEQWKNQEEDPNRVPLNGVDVVSDPRPESGARVYWSLTDQMTRPDYALPYRYRPVDELVAEGFSGVDRRDDIGRLLRYEAVRRRAMVQSRTKDFDPRPARKLAQARAGLLSTILADFVREDGSQTYAPIDSMKIVRDDEGSDKIVVARRRTALWVRPIPASSPPKYVIHVTYAILENNTDLDLKPDDNNQVNITIKLKDDDTPAPINLVEKLPKLFDDEALPDDPQVKAQRHEFLISFDLDLDEAKDLPSVEVFVGRESSNSSAPKESVLIFDPLPLRFDNSLEPMIRQVGLFAVTTDKTLQLDFGNVRIIRNEESSFPEPGKTLPTWAVNRPVRIIPMTDPDREDPVEEIQRWIKCLEPCQEFQAVDVSNNQQEKFKVRVRLPIKFEEELLKSQLPRLNGFEIYRRFPWEKKPVKIAEYVTPIIQRVDEGGGTTLLVENFLFGEDFPYNPNTKRFEDVATGIIPGITQIEYSLRAIPYGRLPSQDQPPTFRRWPAVTLYVPPTEMTLPPLGLVVAVESLILPEMPESEHQIPVQLVDSNHITWDWPEKGWERLEIWAEAEGIKSTGSYALEEEPIEENSQAAQRRDIQSPKDLTIERLPESVKNKIKIATLTSDRSTWKIESKSGLIAGRSYRLFIRPGVATEMPLCHPMPIYLIRKLSERIDDTTPLCYTDRLELISKSELDRILQPMILNGVVKARPESWLLKKLVKTSTLPSINPKLERLRITWDHLSDLDAGVEILIQDVDEPHRFERRLVTALAENVFQTAIRDFRNPDLWHPLPGSEDKKNDKLNELRSNTLKTDDITKLLLWDDERNPALDRVRAARKSLDQELAKYLSSSAPLAPANENPPWVLLHRTLSEYQFALLAYQRTPLAPATPEDREGLNALAAIARALLLGREVEPILSDKDKDPAQNLRNFYDKLIAGEDNLRKALDELAAIDLSKMTVSDTPEDYERIKKELQDIDLAQKFAGIIELRFAIADDLLDPDTSDNDWSFTLKDSIDRLPSFANWESLLSSFDALNKTLPSIDASISSTGKGRPTIVETTVDHGLKSGDRVFITFSSDMEEIDRRVFIVEVEADKPKEFKIDIDSKDFTGGSGGRVQREFMQLTQKLLTFFDKGNVSDGRAKATGQAAALELQKLIEKLIRDPSVLLPTESADPRSSAYRQDIARLVPQAAGLTAALDTLRQDAKARNWTLLRRPHHQLGIESPEGKGRKAVLTPLNIYLPDKIEGAEISDSALVVSFVNLLERFGFAIDLAVVDALNQPLQQARLVDWVDNQNWQALRSSIDTEEIKYEIVLVTGCEPDTDRNLPDKSLGYAFIKLVVVPRNILADLLGRKINVKITGVDGTTITIDKSKEDFTKNGWNETTQISLKSIDDKEIEITTFKLGDLNSINQFTHNGTLVISPDTSTIATANAADRFSFRQWLVQRALLAPDPNQSDPTPTPEPTPSELTELGILQRMAKSWLREITDPLNNENNLGRIIVETRSRRWATVPVLGGQAHLDWEAFDSAGHEVNIAVRRVSRYEALLRWARGTAVPTLTRLYGLDREYYRSIEFLRRMQVGIEEPTSLPVLISPHPTKIEFIYALPTSGARATISGLSARRNGYQGIIAQFIQNRLSILKPIKAGDLNPYDAHQTILNEGIREDYRLVKLTLKTLIDNNNWDVTHVADDLANFDAVVVFSKNHERVRLSKSFVPNPPNPPNPPDLPSGILSFISAEEGHLDIAVGDVISALVHPISDLELTYLSLKGSITRIGAENKFRLTLDRTSDRLDDYPQTYVGQLLIVLNGTDPIHARSIDAFNPSNQIISLDKDPLPNTVTEAPIRILLGAKPLLRNAIDRVEAGEPVLYRNERLISLPALPYYRQYSVQLKPHFNTTAIPKKESKPPEYVYGQRQPSAIATHPGHSIVKSSSATEIVYEFSLVLTRQGDLLTPEERNSEANLAKETDRLSSSIPGFKPLPADLPDLFCHYQVVWPLAQEDPIAFADDAVYAELFDVILPGHPLWIAPSSGTNYVLVRNRSNTNVKLLDSTGVEYATVLHAPISLWCPTFEAQPTYTVKVSIKILEPDQSLFGNPDLALLQVQRDGRRSRPIPITQLKQ
jgi:hypothetical protein